MTIREEFDQLTENKIRSVKNVNDKLRADYISAKKQGSDAFNSFVQKNKSDLLELYRNNSKELSIIKNAPFEYQKTLYYDAKKKGGQALYDYIQKNKSDLQKLFKDNQDELNLITLVPSIADNAKMSGEERDEANRSLKYHPNLSSAKIDEPPTSIKDIREQYSPVVSTLDDAQIRRELRSQGFVNPTEEDVKAYLEKRKTETERIKKADEWERSSPLWKLGLSFVAPRTAESMQEGYSPSKKDIGLDIAENVGLSIGPMGILKGAKLIKPIGRKFRQILGGFKTYQQTGASSLNPIANYVGQLAESAGTTGLATLPIELGLNASDKALYSGDRSRGTDQWNVGDVKDVLGNSVRGAMIAGIASGSKTKNGFTPTEQKKIDLLKKKQYELSPLKEATKHSNEEKEELVKNIYEINRLGGDTNVSLDKIRETVNHNDTGDRILDVMKANELDAKSAYDLVVGKQKGNFSKFITPSQSTSPQSMALTYEDATKQLNDLVEEKFRSQLDKGALFGGLVDLGLTRGNSTFDLLDKDTGY